VHVYGVVCLNLIRQYNRDNRAEMLSFWVVFFSLSSIIGGHGAMFEVFILKLSAKAKNISTE
jgi:hypothetical protein